MHWLHIISEWFFFIISDVMLMEILCVKSNATLFNQSGEFCNTLSQLIILLLLYS